MKTIFKNITGMAILSVAMLLGAGNCLAQEAAKKDTVAVKPQNLPVGTVAPEFSLPDAEGNLISLSSFRGKYVLVDFWASWCPDCRRENPNLVAAYRRFKDKNFTVFGVSMDRKKEAWENAVRKDSLEWTQVLAPQDWKSEVVKLYGIHWIPTGYLLNPDGVIIAVGLEGKDLMDKLESLL